MTVNFRTMLHKIHRGRNLVSAYSVVGSETAAYPDNFTVKSFEDIGFPATPGATQDCSKCHGEGDGSAYFPRDRNHPTEQGVPVLAWRPVCGACHDSSAATAHIELNTAPSGLEACAICHGPGDELDVNLVHHPR